MEEGLAKGVFFKKENGSVWVDLQAEGLDEKLLLRGDGTSVYITQDLGTAELKYQDFDYDSSGHSAAGFPGPRYLLNGLAADDAAIAQQFAASAGHRRYLLIFRGPA